MLLGSFFTIDEKNVTDTTVSATITINALHKIFEGHFPNQPVVPGVCMMQMVKEILETVIGKKTDVKKMGELKFLAIINPVENPAIQTEFTYATKEDGPINITGKFFKAETTFLKFKGIFNPLAS